MVVSTCRYDHHNTQATHGTQRVAHNATQRNAWHATQDNTRRFNHLQAYSTTITLHPVLAGMMKTCSIVTHRIVHLLSECSHIHLPPPSLSLLTLSPLASHVPSCTTTHHLEWGSPRAYVCLLLHSIVFFVPLNMMLLFSVTPAIKCNEWLVIIVDYFLVSYSSMKPCLPILFFALFPLSYLLLFIFIYFCYLLSLKFANHSFSTWMSQESLTSLPQWPRK